MSIEKADFEKWMQRIMDRLDVLGEKVYNIELRRQTVDGEELLDNQDVLGMLKISTRSLQRYRSSGLLPYFIISGKTFYKLSDVQQFVRDCFGRKRKKRNGGDEKSVD